MSKRKEPELSVGARCTSWLLLFFLFCLLLIATSGCAKLSDCCDLKCSICCFVFSLWGVIMLLALGGLLASNYQPVHLNELSEEESLAAATGAFAAAGIYAALAVLCAVRFTVIMCTQRQQAYVRV
jgi:hypothetical protein